MTTQQLYEELNYVNHSREKRLLYANLLLSNPELISNLLEILFQVDDKISCKAAWVLEFTCGENLDYIIPHLDYFTQNMHKVHLDPAVRPVAKVCEYLANAYYSKTENAIKQTLKPEHKERIIELCFDYMINNEKVAAKAYSMHTLFLFGKDFDWIHPELKTILERDFSQQSAAFKARAKRILKKLK
ncbi:adenylosuccinate lyase [Tamlana nanhaiensis]|uniref:Adenylosuccinate lyase n=1 Tax=Neotamlana nanhaiensis TaxID=1382798 RepID=A0A0D7W2V5_9FLAO|nr:hypothetical protein [Tamlana nanhaiensis]KJD33359.1 adenylosuccinate lyase [Tamlana nanhaiensis]